MASSAHRQHHHIRGMYGATSAPPPTPSTLPAAMLDSAASNDLLSTLTHRLPPALSLPTGLSASTSACNFNSSSTTAAAATISSVSYSDQGNGSFFKNLLSASSLGFFQVTDHPVSSETACAAESESLALFNLTDEQKQLYFPKNWPLGYEHGDEDDEGGLSSFCLDSLCSCTESSTELELKSLRQFTISLEKVGLELIQWLSEAVGFKNPDKEEPSRVCSLMWISRGGCMGHHNRAAAMSSGGSYPFAVGLSYQIRSQKYCLLADSGTVSVSPEVSSLMATVGDIAQVWSNGKLKKVRGRPLPCLEGNGHNTTDDNVITMSLLVTLPLDATVAPLLPLKKTMSHDRDGEREEEEGEAENKEGALVSIENEEEEDDDGDVAAFKSFSFEDYAWRVYHDRLISHKEPLDRYRI